MTDQEDGNNILQIQIDVGIAVKEVKEKDVVVQNALMEKVVLQLVNHIQARAMQNELSHCIQIALPANSQRKHIALILCFIHSEYSNIRHCVNIHNLLAIQQRFHNLIASLTTGNMKRISASLFITIWEENDVVLVIWIRIVLQ